MRNAERVTETQISSTHNPTLTQIDSKSASEESQVCIAIAGLYISLSGLSWCYLKVTGHFENHNFTEKISFP